MAATALRAALWLLLGGWVGSWGCFGLVVAPVAFRVLPTTELAGELVGPVLAALHLYGLGAGLALAPLARALGRSPLLMLLPLVMAAACAFTHFWLSARIAAIRPLAVGPEGSLEMAARFTQMHQLSMTIFVVVSAAAVVLVLLHAQADAPGTARRGTQAL